MTALTDEINWDAPPPRRPKMKTLAPLPPGAVTVTITCRVCGLRANIEIAAPAKLCHECAHDLEATKTRVAQGLAHAESRLEQAHLSLAAFQEALPDDLAARYTTAWELRTQAETRLVQAQRRKGASATTPERQLQEIDDARAALSVALARIEKTKANAQNPLSAVLRREDEYRDAVAQAREEQERWMLAMQEVETAESGGIPF